MELITFSWVSQKVSVESELAYYNVAIQNDWHDVTGTPPEGNIMHWITKWLFLDLNLIQQIYFLSP